MAEPFDWMEAKRSPEAVRSQKNRLQATYMTEMQDRATLLQRMGHSKDSTRARLQANAAWDFEGTTSPVSPTQIDAIVDRVFGGGGPGKSGPRGKGG